MAIDRATRWYALEGDDAAHEVVSICDMLERDVGQYLRDRWFAARSRYEARVITDESLVTLSGRATGADPYNVSRSAVDTAQSEIAGRQRPKPMFLTLGADWRTKRKAKRLDRYVEAWFHQRQGQRYADVWELGEDCFRDAECAVGGVCKVTIDVEKERIRYERTPAYEILVDPYEARLGDPQNWFHVYDLDLDSAVAQFATDENGEVDEKIVQKLEASTSYTRNNSSALLARVIPTVRIREAWRLPFSKKKPGKHLFACTAGLLHEEDWEWPWPPFAFIVWSKEAFGIWGTGLVEAGEDQHAKIAEMGINIFSRLKLCASKRTYYEPGTVSEDDLRSNDEEVLIPIHDIGKVPREINAPPITPAESQLLETEMQRFYDIQGISQMSASARKEPGIDSGVAQMTLNDTKATRQVSKARGYEMFFVRLGELTVRAGKDLSALVPNLKVKWSDKKHINEISQKDVELAEDAYQVRVAPVSAMSKDPAQRLQIIEQLVSMQLLSKDKYLELIGLPDLDSVLQQETAESQWVEKMVDRYLDAEDDADLKKQGGYVEPDSYLMNPTAALVAVAQAYFGAMVEDCPEYNAGLMRRFMESLKNLIKKAQPPAPAPNPAAGVPGATPALPPEAVPAPPTVLQ